MTSVQAAMKRVYITYSSFVYKCPNITRAKVDMKIFRDVTSPGLTLNALPARDFGQHAARMALRGPRRVRGPAKASIQRQRFHLRPDDTRLTF